MAEFYQNIVTEKSFKYLQELVKNFKFILIGGWAVFLHAKTLKSKDIDIIIDYEELEKFREKFDVFKNERLKKYEVKKEEVDIDIYLPHFSRLGFPVEDIKKYTQSIEGFTVPLSEVLLILKLHALMGREGSNKGSKDLIDIFSLLKSSEINWKNYNKIIRDYDLKKTNIKLKEAVRGAKAIPELNLLNHKISKLKKSILTEIK
ncbi:MAG: hypothetical protein Q8N88_03435 [Nanoarchaeota archaeon]|nr:hypothetical protein [Nanoarchaeota archaeon]